MGRVSCTAIGAVGCTSTTTLVGMHSTGPSLSLGWRGRSQTSQIPSEGVGATAARKGGTGEWIGAIALFWQSAGHTANQPRGSRDYLWPSSRVP